jgi:hypothetical protein
VIARVEILRPAMIEEDLPRISLMTLIKGILISYPCHQ